MTDYNLEDTIYQKFTTRSFSTGAPTTLAGTPVVSAYEDDSLTQITAGITLTEDFDSVTGLNHLTVAATAANGFESGKDYNLVITTGTVGGVSVVGEVVGTFSIERGATVADVTSILADTNELQTTLSAGIAARSNNNTLEALLGVDDDAAEDTVVFQVWEELLTGGTHNVPNSAGRRLRALSGTILHDGTAQAGAADTITLDTGASALDGFYEQTVVIITNGTGFEQSRVISDYNGTTKVASVTPAWTTAPDNTSEFDIIPGSVHSATMNGGYLNGNVWVDTLAGTAGTTKFVNGTSTRPVNAIADARTIADEVNLKAVFFNSGSSVTLAQSFDRFTFNGRGYTVAFGGQSCVSARFNNGFYTGVLSGATGPLFRQCSVGTSTLPPGTAAIDSVLTGTITLNGVGSWSFQGCKESFSGSAIIDFSTSGNQTCNILEYDGTIEIQNMGNTGTDILNITGDGTLIINANCTGGTINIAGNIDLVNNGSGITINENARFEINQLLSSGQALDTTLGVLDRVTLVDTTTTNTDMRGTDNAALAVDLAVVDTNVDAILVDTGTTIPAQISGLNDISAADVNAQMVDVLTVDTYAEPTGVPPATTSIVNKVSYLYTKARNKTTQTATTFALRNAADNANISTSTVSDDGTTFTKGADT